MLQLAVTGLIGLLGGFAVGFQGPIAGAMSQRLGGLSSSLVIHIGGAVLSGALLAARGGEQLGQSRVLPWYMLGAGALGVILFLTLSLTVPRLGATPAIALVITGQLLAGLLIDQLGLFGIPVRPFDASRALSALLLLGGGYLAVR